MSGPHAPRGDVSLTNAGFFFSPFLSQAALIKSTHAESELFAFSLFFGVKNPIFLIPKTQRPLRTTRDFHSKNWHPALVFLFISNTPEP